MRLLFLLNFTTIPQPGTKTCEVDNTVVYETLYKSKREGADLFGSYDPHFVSLLGGHWSGQQ